MSRGLDFIQFVLLAAEKEMGQGGSRVTGQRGSVLLSVTWAPSSTHITWECARNADTLASHRSPDSESVSSGDSCEKNLSTER